MTRKDPVAVGTLVLAGAAFAGSFTHVQATAAQHSPAGTPVWLSWAIALMPELMVWLAVFRLRQAHRDPAAWVTLTTAGAFTVAANLAQAEASAWGWVVAGWPAWAAISSALMLKLGGSRAGQRKVVDRVKPQVSAPVTPVQAQVQPPAGELGRLHSVTPSDDLAEWVRQQRAAGVKRAEVIRVAVPRFKVSESTVIRRWKEAA